MLPYLFGAYGGVIFSAGFVQDSSFFPVETLTAPGPSLMKFFPLFLQLAISLGDYWDERWCLNETEATETVFMQMLKREKALSTKEYAEAMQCNQQQDSFKLNGGDFVFVLSPSAGVLWGDLMASWEKGPQNQRYIAVDYTFMSKSFQINNYTALSVDVGLGLMHLYYIYVYHYQSLQTILFSLIPNIEASASGS